MNWIFVTIFAILGVGNAWLVHPVPGAFYLLFSLGYLPQTDHFLKRKLGLVIPLALKIVVGLGILWGTLAVGDLAEILGL